MTKETLMRELIEEIQEWIESGGFIDDVHYDDAAIVARINEVLAS